MRKKSTAESASVSDRQGIEDQASQADEARAPIRLLASELLLVRTCIFDSKDIRLVFEVDLRDIQD
jgi:hypothetical protein